jgi:hypothetical protein
MLSGEIVNSMASEVDLRLQEQNYPINLATIMDALNQLGYLSPRERKVIGPNMGIEFEQSKIEQSKEEIANAMIHDPYTWAEIYLDQKELINKGSETIMKAMDLMMLKMVSETEPEGEC